MSPPEPDLNPVSVIVLILTVWLGPQFAAVASAYTVILFGWFGGCFIGALRLPPGGRFRLAAFVVVSFVVTIGLTVSIAEMVVARAPDMLGVSVKTMLFPVAAIIPAVGHSWLDIGQWCAGLLRKRVEQIQETQR